jgi:hypothetical protein
MFGIAVAMRTFVSDSGQPKKEFCFAMFLMPLSQYEATPHEGNKKASLRSLTVGLRSPVITFGAIMTSISATSNPSYQTPLQKLQAELQSEVNSGTISSSDQTALSSALTDIDASLQSSRASDSTSGTKPSPDDLKSKIDNLIAGEVSSGKLTSDQATELKGVFKAAFANGPGGAHGNHGGPPPSDSSASSSTDSSSSSGSTSSVADILQQFLQSLQSSLSSSSSTSYGATGNTSTASTSSSSFSALLIDYKT